MATVNEGDAIPRTPEKPKTKVSPARNAVGLVLLIVFATIFVMEFTANRGYNAAVSAIEAKIPKEDAADPTAQLPELPTKAEVQGQRISKSLISLGLRKRTR